MLTIAGGQGVGSSGGQNNSEGMSGRSESWTTGDVSQSHEDESSGPSETRCCELCGATTTPMWRRGPSGKGTVCNACGVRWASRRRAPRKHVDDSHSSHAHEHVPLEAGSAGIALEQYYCKYCGVTWPLNYFKNRQQFGAHCSNCSRKRKSRDTAPPPPDSEISSTSPRESGSASSPTGPFLPHLNLRAAAAASHHGSHPVPRKMPRSDLNLMHVGPSHYSNTGAQLSLMNTNRWDTDDYMEDFSPPHKRAKLPISSAASSSSGSSSHTMNTNISVESGDETYYYESDSETALSPYGPSANSLHRLLGAVENVLTEEREMAMTLAQLEAMRTMIDSVEETRKRTLGKLEAALVHQLSAIQGLASSECVQATIAEKQRAQEEVARATAAAANPAPTDSPTAPPTTPAVPATTTSLDSTKVPSPEKPAESDAKMYVDSAPPTADAQPIAPTPEHKPVEKEVPSAPAPQPAPTLEQELPKIVESQFQLEVAEAQVEQIMGPLRDQHHSILAPSMTLPLQLLSVLPPELEAAAVDLSSVFANATLLQLGSQADVEAFKQFFVQSLAQSKVRINQEVAVLFETLGALKVRQTQLGQNTFIDQIQLRNLSTDLHELKQRVVHASRAVQNAFVQLVSQFSEQIETAKRIYQESAGNNVKLLDEIIRAQLTPQLTSQVDLLKRQLLAHVNCVRANLAYLDTLVLNTE